LASRLFVVSGDVLRGGDERDWESRCRDLVREARHEARSFLRTSRLRGPSSGAQGCRGSLLSGGAQAPGSERGEGRGSQGGHREVVRPVADLSRGGDGRCRRVGQSLADPSGRAGRPASSPGAGGREVFGVARRQPSQRRAGWALFGASSPFERSAAVGVLRRTRVRRGVRGPEAQAEKASEGHDSKRGSASTSGQPSVVRTDSQEE